MDASVSVERVALDAVGPRNHSDAAGQVHAGPHVVAPHRGRAAKWMDAVDGIQHVALHRAGVAGREDDRAARAVGAGPPRVAAHLGRASEAVELTEAGHDPARRSGRRRPGRHHDRPREIPAVPVGAGCDLRRGADSVDAAVPVHHVAAGAVGKEGQALRDVAMGPGGGGREPRSIPDRVHAAPAVEHVQVAAVVDRRGGLDRGRRARAGSGVEQVGGGQRQYGQSGGRDEQRDATPGGPQ